MKMIRILSIGNSFSQDATRYAHQIAEADGKELLCVNLYIGGCPLEKHAACIKENLAEYELEINGESTGKHISVQDAAALYTYDYVTLQQVSHLSFDYSTYQPYLDFVSNFVKEKLPNAKQVIHQTWAYEEGSDKLHHVGFETRKDMFAGIKNAYEQAEKAIGAAGMIQSGALFETLSKTHKERVHRDTYHASLGFGRYALGLNWYRFFTGGDVMNNSFSAFDEPVSGEEIQFIKETVSKMPQEKGV